MECGASRKIIIIPAYDKRDPDPKQSYGTGAMILVFGLDGPDGCVRFQINTKWNLPHIEKEIASQFAYEIRNTMSSDELLWNPYLPHPSDLSYHSYEQLAPGEFHCERCEWLDGKPCWSYGTSSEAKKVFDVMVREGIDAMWKCLEDFYEDTFRTVRRE